MRSRGGLSTELTWSADRLAEGVEALALAAGLAPRRRLEGEPLGVDAARLGEWLGLEIEPVGFVPGEALALARAAAPAILPAGDRHVLVVRSGRRGALVLAPDGSRHRVRFAALAGATGAEGAAAPGGGIDAGLAAAGLVERERTAVRHAHARERAGEQDRVAWCLRAPAAAPWGSAARALCLRRRLTALFALEGAGQALAVLAWWSIGRGALEGRLDPGWVAAWALALACTVPLQVASLRSAGRLAVDAGAELRRRLMAGCLRMEPDALRREGVGQSLGRVLEAQAFETLALGGGLLALLAAVEVAVALAVLGGGTSPLVQTAALALCIALAVLLALRHLRARRAWTDRRLELTHALVETMLGHATRLAQEDPGQLHDAEDGALADYVERSRALDRTTVALTAWIPRGWVLAGVATTAPAFLAGAPPTRLALSLGGVLLAYRALRRMVEGLGDLAGAAVAWERIAPLLRAAARPAAVADPSLASAGERDRPPSRVPVLEVRALGYRHAGRREPTLAGCDLALARGEKVVLEGPSGSGKSTLAAILAGLRAPGSGMVLAGGLDRSCLGARGWRERVALAPQLHENHVFGGSLLFNALMARAWPPAPRDVEDAERVLRRLGLGPLLERMPAGMLQWVGETGWRLSHGERARVALARALLQRSDVVVVDEGLDALDPASQQTVQEVLLEEDAAVVVVAHP